MIPPKGLTRREFIGATAVGLGLAAGGCADGREKERFGQTLREAVGELTLSSAVGKACLENLEASQRSPEALSEALRRRLSSGLRIRGADKQKLIEGLSQAIREDFASRRDVLSVEGWYLSLTECRVAALGHLLDDGADKASTGGGREYRDAELLEVSRWGPRSTEKGQPFNLQSDGASAFWVRATRVPNDLVLFLGPVELRTTLGDERLSGALTPENADRILEHPGTYPVTLVSHRRRLRQTIGEFEVVDRPGAQGEGESGTAPLDRYRLGSVAAISNWGPRSTRRNMPFNVQSDGGSAFWIDVDLKGEHGEFQLFLGPHALRTRTSRTVISGSLSPELAGDVLQEAGTLPLFLTEVGFQVKQKVGDFRIE